MQIAEAAASSMPAVFHRLSALKIRKRGQRLQRAAGHNRAAQIQVTKLLEIGELRDAEISDPRAARDAALGFACRRPERRRLRRPKGDAVADIQFFETGQQRDGIELDVGHHRRPADAGVAALSAVEAQPLEARKVLQHVERRAGNFGAADVQLLELRERRQVLHADIADLREADVERPEIAELG